jgi:hypothetical protein
VTALLREPGGFEGLLLCRVDTDAGDPSTAELVDEPEGPFDGHPACLTARSLPDPEDYGVPRVDVDLDLIGELVEGAEPVAHHSRNPSCPRYSAGSRGAAV